MGKTLKKGNPENEFKKIKEALKRKPKMKPFSKKERI